MAGASGKAHPMLADFRLSWYLDAVQARLCFESEYRSWSVCRKEEDDSCSLVHSHPRTQTLKVSNKQTIRVLVHQQAISMLRNAGSSLRFDVQAAAAARQR